MEFESSEPDYHKIKDVWVHGDKLDQEKEYVIGTVDAFVAGKGYPTLGSSSDIRYPCPYPMRTALAAAFRNPEHVRNCRNPRWHDIG